MPIRIMITLFVAIVVGATIIVFSKTMIDQAKTDVEKGKPWQEPDTEDQKIISLTKVDAPQIAALIKECYDRHHGKTFEKEQCFVVTGKSGDWVWNDVANSPDLSGMNANVSITDDVEEGAYAFGIFFDPYGSQETIWVQR